MEQGASSTAGIDNQPIFFGQSLSDEGGLRNAYQWIAIVSMIIDHVGYLYDISAFRYVGRFAMPIYGMLFVMTMKQKKVNFTSLLFLAVVSQPPYLYIFEELRLNIIFCFCIFYFTVRVFERRRWGLVFVGFLLMWIPGSYGWYLYIGLGLFYWLDNLVIKGGAFATLTGVYVYVSGVHPRQLLAMLAPFIRRVKARRPNKYLYRYFYPGHLYILAVFNYFIVGSVVRPFADLRYCYIFTQIERFLQWVLSILQ
jgi:hypothetical protein